MNGPTLPIVQARLWWKYKDREWDGYYRLLASMHSCISQAYGVLPAPGVKILGRSHVTPFMNFLADGAAMALLAISREGHDIVDFPNEADLYSMTPLEEVVSYLHRDVSGAFMNIQNGRVDELFFWQLASYIYNVGKLAEGRNRCISYLIQNRHLG